MPTLNFIILKVHTVVLLALVDAQNRFTTDVGTYGRNNDEGSLKGHC